MKKWPFPGDQPLIRARKMALAYRNLAQDQQRNIDLVRQVLEKLDRRLMAFDNPASVVLLDDALEKLGATTSDDLDRRFTEWGETWHCEQPQHYEPDDWVKASIAATLIHTSTKQIGQMRITGRIKGRWDPEINTNGGYLYRVRDVYELSSKMRGRGWRKKGSTDTLNDSGRSDTE